MCDKTTSWSTRNNIAYELTQYPVIVAGKCATNQQVEEHEIILPMN